MILKGLSSVRVSLVVPRDEAMAIEELRRGTLSAEVERYAHVLAQRIGGRAADFARSPLGQEPILKLSGDLRENAARRGLVSHPLHDTGAMLRGVRAEVKGSIAQLVVRGPHAHLAAIHEFGATFRITKATAGHFRFGGFPQESVAWATKNLGRTVDIPARPFLGPALQRAIDAEMRLNPASHLADGLFRLWTVGRHATGSTRVETFERGDGEQWSNEYKEMRPHIGFKVGAWGSRA